MFGLKTQTVFVTLLLGIAILFYGGESKAKDDWQVQMSELAKAMSDIIPDLFKKESSRQDAADLKVKTERIYAIAKKLDQSSLHAAKAPDRDPALPYIAQLLRQNIEQANGGLREGHIEYSKTLLRSSVSYCIACHTRTQGGAQFPLLEAFAKPLEKVSWIDRMEFEAAARQFDPVYLGVIGQLKTGLNLNVTSMDLDKAGRMALAISIRVKKNPEQAILLAQAIIDSPYSTRLLKNDGKAWLKDLKAWQMEKAAYKTEAQLIKAARGLIEGKTEMGHGTEVAYLRASVLMHDSLQKYPDSPSVAEALYLIGLSYDRLHDLGLWSLHELYFQACIKKSPHSELAEKCFKQYNESVTLGYTGSGGMRLPPEVASQLKTLKLLAHRP